MQKPGALRFSPVRPVECYGRDSVMTAVRTNNSIIEMLFSGSGSFLAATHRPSVLRPIPSCLASGVPLIYSSPAMASRFACMPL